MELLPFSWSSEYSMSSNCPRKHILTCIDLPSPLGGLRSAHVAIWNTHLYAQCAGLLLSWNLNPIGPISPVGPAGPVIKSWDWNLFGKSLPAESDPSGLKGQDRSNDTQMPPMTYADIITFQYIWHITIFSDVSANPMSLKVTLCPWQGWSQAIPMHEVKSVMCRSNQWCNTSFLHSPDRIEATQTTAKSPTLETNTFLKNDFLSSFTCCYQKTARSANIYEGPDWPGFSRRAKRNTNRKTDRKHKHEHTQAHDFGAWKMRNFGIWYRIKNTLWWWWLMYRECLWCLSSIDVLLDCPLVKKCSCEILDYFILFSQFTKLLLLKFVIFSNSCYIFTTFLQKFSNFSFCLTS